MSESISDGQVLTGTVIEEDLEEPRRYKVLLHNDDYTTMEFVVYVLKKVFHKTEAEAHHIMMSVHKNGIGVCGVYPKEVAETKVAMVRHMARKEGYPLKCTMEEV
ncbi:ATP-dependent Clp protease adapter ClpS [Desulfohalobiaceae bacterium Ax17]|uniref:ATP-dependent Clp protease adapter ClpS n=1 Tax=Desulfovulcanus ferrireducens TaxID=2831190 RepID=UPI00207BB3CC|nr:ATP-dependent Clp protease adapter ClpS [Desulfovulcanus ferrireducens]MBT8762932.1 ATP-dependent Clp protease adapter ClpS [Desulfovulcanus ferrireducens]